MTKISIREIETAIKDVMRGSEIQFSDSVYEEKDGVLRLIIFFNRLFTESNVILYTKLLFVVDKEKEYIADKPRKRKAKIEFVPPTFEEVKAYIVEKGYAVNPQTFYDYFTAGDPKWVDKNGSPVLNWKQKIVTWHSKSVGNKPAQPKPRVFKIGTADYE